MSFFIAWANRLLHHTPPPVPADQPRMRADRNSHLAHQQLLAKAKSGGIDVYFVGDSITRRWGALDYPDFLAHWNKSFHGWNAGDFGWGADRTENILWRLENGELDGVDPKVIVILAGTNNVGKEPGDESKVADVTRGLSAIVAACRKKAPAATIVLTAIFPRNDNPAVMPTIDRINANLAKMADGKSIRFLDVNPRLADAKRHPVRGDDGRRAAPEPEGLRGLGRRPQADPHGATGPAGRHRPRSAAHGRSQRDSEGPPGWLELGKP